MADIELRRAGFWRRFGGGLIDCLVVLVPLQMLVALAFFATDGAIQGSFGIATQTCVAVELSATDSARLRPPPPENANVAVRCDTGLFGFATAKTLTVVRQEIRKTERGGELSTAISVGYSLNSTGEVVAATDMGLPALLFLAVAIVGQWALAGRTIGGRLLRMRVVVAGAAESGGLGWWRGLKRLASWGLAHFGLVIPGFAVMLYLSNQGADVFVAAFWGWPAALMFGGMALQAGVGIWMIVDIVRRRDPIYDRWAGTAAIMG